MYSRIPMPQVEWNEDNRRYSLALFPLVGAIIGTLLVVWTLISDLLDMGKWLYAAVCCLIPIAVTGGIHADGFSDVTDAKSSYAPREKKLEIMSDPHVGSFAVIFTVLYFIQRELVQSGFQFQPAPADIPELLPDDVDRIALADFLRRLRAGDSV